MTAKTPKQKPFATEAELCARFIAAIGADWTAYAETEGWDILLVRKADGFQIGIEAKLKFNLDVVTQALETNTYAVVSPGPDCRAGTGRHSEVSPPRLVTTGRARSPPLARFMRLEIRFEDIINQPLRATAMICALLCPWWPELKPVDLAALVKKRSPDCAPDLAIEGENLHDAERARK